MRKINTFVKTILVLLMIFLIVGNIETIVAQTSGGITGKVTDKATQEALFGANVMIKGTSLGGATDFDGTFLIRNVPVGKQILEVSYIGYVKKSFNVTITANRLLSFDVELDYEVLEGETVIVQGQAKGQLQAINQQLSSTGITNIVSADRIREVPDANAAESVGRLPGVSIKRSSGEGNEVVIRGIQPRLNLITINNIRMPSTNENNTAVGLAGISQYMLDGIEVRKSLRASDDADVVGGIVDLKLATAPKGLQANAILEGMYNGLTKDAGSYRSSINVSNRFFDDKLGVIAQINLEQADRPNYGLSAGYDRDRNENNNRGVYLTNGIYKKYDIIRDRLGATLLLDYKLPKGKIQLNSIYNSFDEDRWERDDKFTSGPNSTKSSVKQMRSVYNEDYTLINSLSLETEVFGVANFDIGAAYTTGHREGKTNAMSFIYDIGLKQPFTDFILEDPYGKTGYDLINNIVDTGSTSKNYMINRMFREDREFEETEGTIQTNLEVPFSISSQISGSFKVGGKIRFKDRNYDYSYDGDTGGIYGGDSDILQQIMEDNPEVEWAPWRAGTGDFYAYPLYGSGDPEKILDDKFALKYFSQRKWIDQIVERASDANWANLPQWYSSVAADLANDYKGDEELHAGYFMLDLNWAKKISLNVGLRYENEETNYSGFGVADVASTPYDKLDTLKNSIRTNEYFLPSATLQFNYSDWGDVRLAYSKSLARPEYYAFIPHYSADIMNSLTGNTQAGYFTAASGAAGNTNLEPAVSNNFDLILSFYNNYIGLFTVGGFYKEIENFFYRKDYRVLAQTILEDNQVLADNNYNHTVPGGQRIIIWENLDDTSFLRGLEFSWQTNLWYLPAPVNGLVLGLNYSKISSSAKYYTSRINQFVPNPATPWIIEETRIDSFQTTSLLDQPNDIFNISVGYDYKDFSMRVAYNFQGKILTWKSDYLESDAYTQDYSRLDLSIRQKLPIDGLSVQFLLSNLTEEVDMSYTYTKDFNNSEQYYGMTGSLGIRYELR